MATKLYVGNLPFNITTTQVQELFSQAGRVTDVYIVVDRYTSKPKGFAFVEMANDEAAETAIKTLNGHLINERPLTVHQTRTSEERPTHGMGSKTYTSDKKSS